MEAKKARRKKEVKPKLDVRLLTIKEVEKALNSLPVIDRIKLSGKLKNGKINLNFIK